MTTVHHGMRMAKFAPANLNISTVLERNRNCFTMRVLTLDFAPEVVHFAYPAKLSRFENRIHGSHPL